MRITELKGIGEKTEKLFFKLNIHSAEELLFFFPRDYEQFESPVNLCNAQTENLCTVQARITSTVTTKHIRGLTISSFKVISMDNTPMTMTYFNMPYLKNSIKQNDIYMFRGILLKKGTVYCMEQAKMYKPDAYGRLLNSLQPIYPTTKGLTSLTISKAVKQVIHNKNLVKEYLPQSLIERNAYCSYEKAIEQIHFPESKESLIAARERLVFDEFFQFILSIRRIRTNNSDIRSPYAMIEVAETNRLIESLPYTLTSAQQKVWSELKTDLCSGHVMNRLIQGDVGSGKTILAFLSLIMCVANGLQGAMMAPTEVLAKQHFENYLQLQKKYGIPGKAVLLTGSTTVVARREIYKQIAEGQANIIFGTHALIQDNVIYKNLALVITDEQHRFGVRQRENFAQKGKEVHVLVMSATPIPRTLAIILYGDLHISVLNEVPSTRLPIKNCVVTTQYRPKAYQFIENEVLKGRQVYVICPMVEESEALDLEDVISYASKLRSILPPSIRIDTLHGQMRSSEKNRIMEQFEAHLIDVLVSTTVVEVGINVPNATVMLIENAERFGLAQLHQLRGRVGRGEYQSFCIFMSKSDNPETLKRLKILNDSNDGFYIAGQDLKLRGPGDLFGIRQSGDLKFHIGDIFQDAEILKTASEEAERILEEDPDLTHSEHIALKERLTYNSINSVDFRSI